MKAKNVKKKVKSNITFYIFIELAYWETRKNVGLSLHFIISHTWLIKIFINPYQCSFEISIRQIEYKIR